MNRGNCVEISVHLLSTFSRLRFPGANFADANLTEADFAPYGQSSSGSYIKPWSDFRKASFPSAILQGAHFEGADIRGTDFAEAQFFVKEDFEGVFEGAIWDEDTKWPEEFMPPESDANV